MHALTRNPLHLAFTNRNGDRSPARHPEVIPKSMNDPAADIDRSSYDFHHLHKINLEGPNGQNVTVQARCSPMEYEGAPATCIHIFCYDRRLQMERVFVLSRDAQFIGDTIAVMSARLARITEDDPAYEKLSRRFEYTAAFDKGILIPCPSTPPASSTKTNTSSP